MSNRTLWGLVVAAVGAVIVLAVMANRHGSPRVESAQSGPAGDVTLPGPSAPDPVVVPRAPIVRPSIRPAAPEPESSVVKEIPQSQPATRPARAGRPTVAFAEAAKEEAITPQKVARVALGYVGADPVAEQVWEAAINNPNFTANERKDLIEDLNEEGFDDPKNLTAADLPLIVSRIQLIENLAPQAADGVNAAAFAEAYKDLVNMYAKLTK